MKRLWTHAEAAQSSAAQAKQIAKTDAKADARAEARQVPHAHTLQSIHEKAQQALNALQAAQMQAKQALQPRRETRAPQPEPKGASSDPDDTVRNIVQRLRTISENAATKRATQVEDMQAMRDARAAIAQAPQAETQQMRAPRAEVTQVLRDPRNPQGLQRPRAAHDYTMQAPRAPQIPQVGRGAQEGAGGKGFLARAMTALRGTAQKPPPAPAEDAQTTRPTNMRALQALRARYDMQGVAGDDGSGVMGGGAILAHLGFDPSSIEHTEAMVGNGITAIDLHSGPNWRIYYFEAGSEPFWMLCPGDPPQGGARSGATRAEEVNQAKRLKKAIEDKHGRK
jgi:hypothetical protein